GIFEHLWNNRFIANIQITSSETIGVEERAQYYDESGAIRDMVQNHMLQMVSLLAMEPPIKLSPEDIRSEKVKVLRALRPIAKAAVEYSFYIGQSGGGGINRNDARGCRDEFRQTSNSENFFTVKLMIDTHRWAGEPCHIRTWKRMKEKSTKILVEFKDIPMY